GVDGLVLRKLACPELLQSRLEALDGLEALMCGIGRAVFKLFVVPVETCGGSLGGVPSEVGVEVVVHEDGKRQGGICGLGLRAARACADRQSHTEQTQQKSGAAKHRIPSGGSSFPGVSISRRGLLRHSRTMADPLDLRDEDDAPGPSVCFKGILPKRNDPDQ